MVKEARREKFLFWLITHSDKPLLWVVTIIGSSILTNTGWPILIGLGLVLFGVVAFAAGINMALESTLGDNYVLKYKEKENKNDATY
jgi:hypothetical protein